MRKLSGAPSGATRLLALISRAGSRGSVSAGSICIDLARRQMLGGGTLVSFFLHSKAAALKLANAL